MSTLNRIRKIAFGLTLAVVHVAAPAADTTAELGEMTVVAQREAVAVVDLGSMTVAARREAVTVADLGSMTVVAWHEAVAVADLGSITVSAPRLTRVSTSMASGTGPVRSRY